MCHQCRKKIAYITGGSRLKLFEFAKKILHSEEENIVSGIIWNKMKFLFINSLKIFTFQIR